MEDEHEAEKASIEGKKANRFRTALEVLTDFQEGADLNNVMSNLPESVTIHS